jgi:TonB family protein
MNRTPSAAKWHESQAQKSAPLYAILFAAFLLSAPVRAIAQASPGPINPAAAPQDSSEAQPQPPPPPRNTMRPTGFGAYPSNAVDLAAATQEFSTKLSAALAGWQDSGGAARKPKIVVLDLSAPDNQWLPFGAWLADNISAALSSNSAAFEVIDRAKLAASLKSRHIAPKDEFFPTNAVDLAKSLGADLIVDGTFTALDNDLGVRINSRRASVNERPLVFVKSRITISSEVASHLGEPLDALRPKPDPSANDAYRPGRNGVSRPVCTYCPPAEFSEYARKKKITGTVTLSVLISPEGHATDIQVTTPLEPSLDQQAIKTVEAWRFEPAKDSNGVAVPVHIAIEVSFRLY